MTTKPENTNAQEMTVEEALSLAAKLLRQAGHRKTASAVVGMRDAIHGRALHGRSAAYRRGVEAAEFGATQDLFQKKAG